MTFSGIKAFSDTRWLMLMALVLMPDGDELPASALAEIVDLPPSTAASALIRIADSGTGVTTRVGPEAAPHRRRTLFGLTPEGREWVRADLTDGLRENPAMRERAAQLGIFDHKR